MSPIPDLARGAEPGALQALPPDVSGASGSEGLLR
jgi:hypothetical protein